MKREPYDLDDPKLNRIFRKAYQATLKEVERREKRKNVQDHIQAHVELFERELDGRDLSSSEQQAFVNAFKSKMKAAEKRRERRRESGKRLLAIGAGSVGALALLVFVLIVAVRRPFLPLAEVEARLQYYLEKVDDGYGDFSQKFYILLRRQDQRLGPAKTHRYQQDMYAELDENFREYLERLENGEVAYIDDARRWADYFPEREERKARKKMASNAIVGGVGENIGDAVNSILDGAKEIIDRTIDAIDKD